MDLKFTSYIANACIKYSRSSRSKACHFFNPRYPTSDELSFFTMHSHFLRLQLHLVLTINFSCIFNVPTWNGILRALDIFDFPSRGIIGAPSWFTWDILQRVTHQHYRGEPFHLGSFCSPYLQWICFFYIRMKLPRLCPFSACVLIPVRMNSSKHDHCKVWEQGCTRHLSLKAIGEQYINENFSTPMSG